MDDKEFKQKLSTVAKWYIPIVSDRSSGRDSRKPMPTSQPNETVGPRIESLTTLERPCEWCGIINTSKKNHTLRIVNPNSKNPTPQWEHSCQTCKRHWDANTGQLKEKTKRTPLTKKEKISLANKQHWWNDVDVYTVSDKDKLG